VLALVIGPMLERALRQAMTMSKGDVSIFFTRPISLAMLVVVALLVLLPIIAGQLRKPHSAQAAPAGTQESLDNI
jgi:putative tricarboxylic transport membrane protein